MGAAHAVRAQDRPLIVAVNYPLSYFAERLTDGAAAVLYPVPAGRDPAFWRPGVSQISTIQGADLILLNGAGFAAWTTKASLPRSRLVDTSRAFESRYIATDTVTHSHGAEGEHSHTGTASFTWLDPEQAAIQAEAVADALKRRRLAEPDRVDARLAALTEDLQRLDAAAAALRPLAAGRVLIATHPRYQYFARQYGLDIRYLEWDAGETPAPAQLDQLEALVRETGADVLIWEAAPPPQAREAARELGVADVVFPTLAAPPQRGDYVSELTASIEALTNTLDKQD